MMGDRLEVALLGDARQHVRRALVQSPAAQRVAFGVDRLPDQRMRELHALRRARRRPQQVRAEQLVERRLGAIGLKARDGFEDPEVGLEPEDGGHRQERCGVLAEAPDANGDGLAHAVGDLVDLAVRQPAQQLLDEERVSTAARVHGAGHALGGVIVQP